MGGKKWQQKLEKLLNLIGMKTQYLEMYGVHTLTKLLTRGPQNCQDRQKQGKSGRLSV